MAQDSKENSSVTRGLFHALLAFGLFSTHDAIVKVLGENYSVFQIIFFSALFAFVPVSILMTADGVVDNFRPRHPWYLLGRTIASVIGITSAFYAFTVLPLTEVYALLFATPLLITMLSVPLLGEPVGARRWFAVIVGLIGVLIVLRPGYTDFSPGHAAALTASLMTAMSSIIIRKIGKEERGAVLLLYPLIGHVIFMALFLPAVYVPVALPDLGLMAVIGVLVMLAQVSIISAFRVAPAVVVAPIQYTQIIWAVLFGYFLFGSFPDIWVALGASVIIASGLFVVWREHRGNVSINTPVLKVRNLRADTGPTHRPGHG